LYSAEDHGKINKIFMAGRSCVFGRERGRSRGERVRPRGERVAPRWCVDQVNTKMVCRSSECSLFH